MQIPAVVPLSFRRGFTLIEVILYVAILSIFLLGLINFAWDTIYGREKASAQQSVEQATRLILNRFGYEVGRATDFTINSADSISLTSATGTTTIAVNGSQLEITPPGASTESLHSQQVRISSFSVTDLSSSDEDSRGFQIAVTVDSAQTGSAQFDAEISAAASYELKHPFNQAKRLLINLSSVSITPNGRDIEEIQLENVGNAGLTVDQISLSWINSAGGENVTEIQLDGSTVWSGSQPSGSTLDVTDTSISATTAIPINVISFDDTVDNAVITMGVVLSDGSTQFAEFDVDTGVGPPDPSPTPSPSPSPSGSPSPSPSPTTCAAVCQTLGYSSGTCRSNNATCVANGETQQAAGNIFCTGGASADTCCCAP